MKLITTKRYKELIADSHENLAREITITNLNNELRKKDSEIRKKDMDIKRLKGELYAKSQGKAATGKKPTNDSGK